ncbi:hypothetical protein QTN25_004107 [Entamoeba marina]
MFTFLALCTVAFTAEFVTEVTYRSTYNNQVLQFYLYELGACYIYSSGPRYAKLTWGGDKYIKTFHYQPDCSDEGLIILTSNDFVERKTGFSYGSFTGGTGCSYTLDSKNKINYHYTVFGCIANSESSSFYHAVVGTTLKRIMFDSDNCSGVPTKEIDIHACETCNNGTYGDSYFTCIGNLPTESSSSAIESSDTSESITTEESSFTLESSIADESNTTIESSSKIESSTTEESNTTEEPSTTIESSSTENNENNGTILTIIIFAITTILMFI